MGGQVFECPDGLREFVHRCRRSLLCGQPIPFEYPAGYSVGYWPVERIGALYEKFTEAHMVKGNMYAIWTRDIQEDIWRPRYVGQRASEGFKIRIKNHLVETRGPESKIEKVKDAVFWYSQIALSFIMVKPEAARLCVEQIIIALERNESERRLDWNERGTGPFLRNEAREWMSANAR